ncbi:carcinoembryonic antigen-related cell adhesion molecule 20-like isoform X1 [Conger conger]|uniref:carcinoembryonic antigen-related cell adhesion molecule 20-like isoform X1 n=1 Tax=Conger conger TaxID=82655 RepID=UPI002A5A1A9E|nr:carcinoembryonic antigen-related cell adhesion molecule 20-like isoform X1 [Conger conger]
MNPAHPTAWLVLTLTGAISVIFPHGATAFPNARGPYFTTIEGPDTVTAGEVSEFTCTAECSPECTYTWSVDGHTNTSPTITLRTRGLTSTVEMECTSLNPASGKTSSMKKSLRVENPVSVRPAAGEEPSLNQSFHLTCVGFAQMSTIEWYKDSDILVMDAQTTLSADNTTLSFSSLLPSHSGLYRCVPSKGDTVIVSVGYLLTCGPYFTKIEGPDTVTAGEASEFTCTAECSPECTYTWSVDGQTNTSPTIIVTPSGLTSTVEMKCTSLNPASGKTSSMKKSPRVENPVSVRPAAGEEPSLNQSFHLTCVGFAQMSTIKWYKDSDILVMDAQTTLSADNTTLSFSSLLPSHSGLYRCVPSKGDTRIVSVGYLLTYGPLSVTISGPDTVEVGTEYTFVCESNCEIPCDIYWTFRQGFPSGRYIQRRTVINWTPDTPNRDQLFACVVENTYASAMATKLVRVVEKPEEKVKPESGCMALQPTTTLGLMLCMALLFLWGW